MRVPLPLDEHLVVTVALDDLARPEGRCRGDAQDVLTSLMVRPALLADPLAMHVAVEYQRDLDVDQGVLDRTRVDEPSVRGDVRRRRER